MEEISNAYIGCTISLTTFPGNNIDTKRRRDKINVWSNTKQEGDKTSEVKQ